MGLPNLLANRRTPRLQPSARELLLLRAAVLDREPALVAWKQWRHGSGGPGLDARYRRYFPQVWQNLRADLQDDPLKETLAAAYHRTWAHNQFLHRRAGRALTDLHEAGVKTLVLKGAALNAVYYADVGVRPMVDVDVLVPRTSLAFADAALRASGWTPDHPGYHRTTRALHSEGFSEPGGGQIDLHWRTLYVPTREGGTWRAAVPVDIGGVPTLAPCPADQLLHTCADGSLLEWLAPVRWVPDALAVLRHGVDWQRLVRRTAAQRLSIPVSATLGFLAREFPGSVPDGVVEQLDALPRTPLERLAHRFAMGRPSRIAYLMFDLDRYARIRRIGFDGDAPVRFSRYVLESHHLEGWAPYARRTARRVMDQARARHASKPGKGSSERLG